MWGHLKIIVEGLHKMPLQGIDDFDITLDQLGQKLHEVLRDHLITELKGQVACRDKQPEHIAFL